MWLPLLLPAAAATVLVVVATRNGVGLSADSAHYIGAARELAAGHGLVVPWGAPAPRPLDLWPPLYPALLAGIDAAGPDPVVSVRWLHALCLGVTVFVAGRLIFAATRGIWLAFLCAMLLAGGGNLLRIHMMAWSEPVFLCVSVCATAALIQWCHTGGRARFAGAALLFGLAALTRYAGVGLAAGAGIALLVGFGSLRQRLVRFAAFGLLSALPLAGWMIWLSAQGRAPTTRVLSWYPRYDTMLADAGGALARLLLPDGLAGRTAGLVVLAVAAACVLLAAFDARRLPFRQDVGLTTLRHRGRWILAGAIGGYLAFYAASGLFFDPAIDFADVRHFITPYVLGYWLLVLSLYDVWEREGRRPAIAATALTGCVALCALMAPRAIDYSDRLAMGSGSGGQGYHDRKWRTSPTLAALESVPVGTPIYSNAPDAVYLLTGRPTIWLPRREAWQEDGGGANDASRRGAFRKAVDDVRAALAAGGRIVYLDRVAWRGASPRADDLERALPVRADVNTVDGRIYSWAGEAE